MSNTKIVLSGLKNVIRKSKPSIKKKDQENNSNNKIDEIYDGTIDDIYEIFKKTDYNYENEEYQTLNSSDSSNGFETNLSAEDDVSYESESSFSFSDSSLSD